jgi:hypothetical protein
VAARLPANLRQLARALLGAGRDHEATARLLDARSTRDRLRLCQALLPGMARSVEGGWILAQRLPYQAGNEDKVFRAPHTPAVTQRARGDWLADLIALVKGCPCDVGWLAEHAAELDGYGAPGVLAVLFAAAVDGGGPDGDRVFAALRRSGGGRAGDLPEPHAVRALLVAARPDGWQFVERRLLDSRGEPRPVALECAGAAHPEAFRRFLRLVREHDLARFGPVVQTLDGWLGYAWSAVSLRVVNRVLELVVCFLEDPVARLRALQSQDGETVYLALWALAFEDAVAAVRPAAQLLKDSQPERRFAAAHLLGQLDLPGARRSLRAALDDGDLRVALCALEGFGRDLDEENGRAPVRDDVFERIERLLARMPAKRTPLEPIIWPWQVLTADVQEVAADLIGHLGPRPAARLLAHLPRMDVPRRRQVVQKAAGLKRSTLRARRASPQR